MSKRLLNKGMSAGNHINAKLSATGNKADVLKNESKFGPINANEMQYCNTPFTFQVRADSIEIVKFRLTIKDGNKNVGYEFFELPIKRDLPEIKNFEIADGRMLTVA